MARKAIFVIIVILLAALSFAQTTSPVTNTCTLTIQVSGVNQQAGNIGVLVFNSSKGWAEDRNAALKDVVVPAHQGVVTVKIPDLPPGKYAVALVHDVNMNHKVDKNFLGVPKEQWGISNNPKAYIKTPAYSSAEFEIKGDTEIQVRMQ